MHVIFLFRGMTQLNKKEIIDIYGGLYISQEMIRGPSAGVCALKLSCIRNLPILL